MNKWKEISCKRKGVIFTWKSRGVLNDTIWRIFCQFLLFGDYEKAEGDKDSILQSIKNYRWKMWFLLEDRETS